MKLSIYIPSYKRAEFFNRLLNTIEPQLHEDVEVIASLNPPCDGYTLPPWLKVFRNGINVGGRTNFLMGPLRAQGEYLWMLGDDEQLLPGAISEVLQCLDSNPGIVVMSDGRKSLGVPLGSQYDSYVQMLLAAHRNNFPWLAPMLTLCSATVFKREMFDLELAVLKQDTLYGQHYGMLSHLLHKPVRVVRTPTFRSGSSTEASVYLHSDEIVQEHLSCYPRVIYNLVEWINERAQINLPVWESWDPYKGFDC